MLKKIKSYEWIVYSSNNNNKIIGSVFSQSSWRALEKAQKKYGINVWIIKKYEQPNAYRRLA